MGPRHRRSECGPLQPRRATGLFAITATMLIAGCATSYQGVKSERGSGTRQSFQGSSENAWRACILALHELGLELKELDPERQYVLAGHGSSMFSYGEHVGCFVGGDAVPGRQSVEIVSQRVAATNVFATDWSDDALWTIGVHLARLEGAEPGPWLQASDVDACVLEALEVGKSSNLEISWDEKKRCRKDAHGSADKEAACLAERERVRNGWIVYADPEVLQSCLADRQERAGRDRASSQTRGAADPV